MDSIINALQSMMDQGLDPKRIQSALREAEDVLSVFDKSVQNHKRVEDMLASADRKFDTADRRAQKQKPEIVSAVDIVPPFFRPGFLQNLALGPELTKIDNAMHGLGLTSQRDMDLARNASEQLYFSLKRNGLTTIDELRAAWLKARESEIRAEEGLKPLHDEFVAIRTEIAKLQSEGDLSDRVIELENLGVQAKILKVNSEGLGGVYKSLVDSALSGLGNIGGILIKIVTDTKNALADLKNLFESVLGSILSSLLKLAVTKILIKLFPELADPSVKTQTANTIAAVQNTVATRANTAAEQENTSAVMDLTAEIRRLIAALQQQASQQGGGGDMGTLGKVVGGLFGVGVGVLTGGAGIPAFAAMGSSLGGSLFSSHADGGLMSADHIAKVHKNEYIVNSPMTSQLQSVLDRGSFGGGDHFDFSGAVFGPQLTPSDVRTTMRGAVKDLRRAGGRSKNGRF